MPISRILTAMALALALSGCAGLTQDQIDSVLAAEKLHPWHETADYQVNDTWRVHVIQDLAPIAPDMCAATAYSFYVDRTQQPLQVAQRSHGALFAPVACAGASPESFVERSGPARDADLIVAWRATLALSRGVLPDDATVDWGNVDPGYGMRTILPGSLTAVGAAPNGDVVVDFGALEFKVTVKDGKAARIVVGTLVGIPVIVT